MDELGRRACVASPTTQTNVLTSKKKGRVRRTRAKVVSLHQDDAKASTNSVDSDPGAPDDDQYVKHVFLFRRPGHVPSSPAPLEDIQYHMPRGQGGSRSELFT